MKKNFFQSVSTFVSNLFASKKAERVFLQCYFYSEALEKYMTMKGLEFISTEDFLYVTTSESVHADLKVIERNEMTAAEKHALDVIEEVKVAPVVSSEVKPIVTTCMSEEQTPEEFYAEFDVESVLPSKKVAPVIAMPVSEKKEEKVEDKKVSIDVSSLQFPERPVKPSYDGMSAEEKADAKKKYQKAYDAWWNACDRIKKNAAKGIATPSAKSEVKATEKPVETKSEVKEAAVEGLPARPTKPDYSGMSEDEKKEARKTYQKAYDKWYNECQKIKKNAAKAESTEPKAEVKNEQQPEQPKEKPVETKVETIDFSTMKTADIVSGMSVLLEGYKYKTANIKPLRYKVGKTEYCFCQITLEDGKVKVYGEHNGVVKSFTLCQPMFSKAFAIHAHETMTEAGKKENTQPTEAKDEKPEAKEQPVAPKTSEDKIEDAAKKVQQKKEELKNEVAQNQNAVYEMNRIAAGIYKTMLNKKMKSVGLDIDFRGCNISSIENRESGLALTIIKEGNTRNFNLNALIKKNCETVMNVELLKTIAKHVNECA